ncbi:hypothetical protein LINGRAHAP2_LOCUS34005 [Linum grandiflorum]
MEYYYNYHFSSLSNKLMIVLLLTITITGPAAGDEQFCSPKAPSDHGPCTSDFAGCVNEVLKQLVDSTPYDKRRRFTASFPLNGQPSGGFTGHATCVDGSSESDCSSCLGGAQGWLSTNCAGKSRKGHYYYGICTMSFDQIA